jgi:alpha-L-fucosidase
MSRTVCIAAVLCLAVCSCTRVEAAGVQKGIGAGDENIERTKWWRDARFGMFIHWGLYAVPAGQWHDTVSEHEYGEWLMFHLKVPVAQYEQVAKKFNPVKFNAEEWTKLARTAGMKYMVITSKHHDGFSMFDSKVTEYNIVDATPFGRDPMKDLAHACGKEGIKFGFYYSVDRDWHHPDAEGNTWDYPNESKKDFQKYLDEFAMVQIEELLTQYGPLGILWFDGIGKKTDAQNEAILGLMRKHQPNCLVNSRLGDWKSYKWGDYRSMDDNEVSDRELGYGWENPGTLNNSYGYNKHDHDWKGPGEIVEMLVDIVSKGGNYLLNVGPKADGTIPTEAVSTLRAVGRWMDKYGESIYGTSASPIGQPEWGRCTAKAGKLYLHIFDWPGDGQLVAKAVKSEVKRAYMLADPGKKGLGFKQSSNGDVVVRIRDSGVSAEALDPSDTVIVLEI